MGKQLICDNEELKVFNKGEKYEVVREDKIHLTLIDNNGHRHTLIRRWVNKNFKTIEVEEA